MLAQHEQQQVELVEQELDEVKKLLHNAEARESAARDAAMEVRASAWV